MKYFIGGKFKKQKYKNFYKILTERKIKIFEVLT